jgi:DNA-binding MarR family transcriptional regulator
VANTRKVTSGAASDAGVHFREAYWAALRELDSVRLRLWEQTGLTLPQLRVLFQIRRTPGVTAGELSKLLGTAPSTTSGLVAKLEQRGLVERGREPDDRRREPLLLTDRGAGVAGGLSEATRPYLEQIAHALGDDIGAVTATLERVALVARSVRESNTTTEDAVPPQLKHNAAAEGGAR